MPIKWLQTNALKYSPKEKEISADWAKVGRIPLTGLTQKPNRDKDNHFIIINYIIEKIIWHIILETYM